jgi:hypothetical protein
MVTIIGELGTTLSVINKPNPILLPKLGTSLFSLAVYKPTHYLLPPLLSASSIWYSIVTLPFTFCISS